MGKHTLKAVHDDDLTEVLEELGLLTAIGAGRTFCHFCSEPVSLESLYALFRESGQIRLVCSKPICVRALHRARYNA